MGSIQATANGPWLQGFSVLSDSWDVCSQPARGSMENSSMQVQCKCEKERVGMGECAYCTSSLILELMQCTLHHKAGKAVLVVLVVKCIVASSTPICFSLKCTVFFMSAVHWVYKSLKTNKFGNAAGPILVWSLSGECKTLLNRKPIAQSPAFTLILKRQRISLLIKPILNWINTSIQGIL